MFATYSVEPNVMRSVVSSSYSINVAKVNVIGGYQGLNTFTISGRVKVDEIFHSDCSMSHIHLLVNHLEIVQILASYEGKEIEQWLKTFYSKRSSHHSNNINNIKGSNFMYFLDSYFI